MSAGRLPILPALARLWPPLGQVAVAEVLASLIRLKAGLGASPKASLASNWLKFGLPFVQLFNRLDFLLFALHFNK